MRDAELRAKAGHMARLIGGFRAQAMIYSESHKLATRLHGPVMGQHEQGQRVAAAGDRNANRP